MKEEELKLQFQQVASMIFLLYLRNGDPLCLNPEVKQMAWTVYLGSCLQFLINDIQNDYQLGSVLWLVYCYASNQVLNKAWEEICKVLPKK